MSKKDVIYLDNEDDITKVISRVKDSNEKLVALVLPKKADVFQSSVNLRLLKNSADKAGKKVVLISKDKALYPVAGASAMFVAETLKSHPFIPKVDTEFNEDDSVIEDDSKMDAAVAVGVLAADQKDQADPKPPEKPEKPESKSKLSVPNFTRFRSRTFLMIFGAIVFIIGWIIAFRVLPTADITIYAQTSLIDTDFNFKTDTSINSDNLDKDLLRAEEQTLKKTVTETFKATGQKDVGNKATGTMSVENCDTSDDLPLPAGTIFTDPSTGFGFSSDAAITVPGASFSGGGCDVAGTADVSVTAVASGDDKNLSARTYTSNYSASLTGSGSAMSGGTTEIVTVVSQADVNKAKRALEDDPQEDARAEVIALFGEDLYALVDTYTEKQGQVSSKPDIGEEAENAEISIQYTYTMLGVSRDGLSQLINKNQSSQITEGQQVILDNGLDTAIITTVNEINNNRIEHNLRTEGHAGPELNTDAIAEEVSGKRFSEVISIIESKAGVQSVDVSFSPFYVFSAPSASKITITVEISDVSLQ